MSANVRVPNCEKAPLSSTVSSGGGAPHVRRLKTLRRNRGEKENTRKLVKLETVLGVTATSNASLATAPCTGIAEYILCIDCTTVLKAL